MLKKIFEKIEKYDEIAIFPHKDADGDALGTAFGLMLVLAGMGKRAKVFLEEDNRLLSHLYGADGTMCLGDNYLSIAVDSAELDRLGTRIDKFLGGREKIVLDHHKSCIGFGDLNYIDANAAACGEVIYDFIVENDILLSRDIAHNLYLAISSDTGGFRQSNTSAKTHKIAAKLMEIGVDSDKINQALFQENTLAHYKLLSIALSHLEVENGVCTMYITLDDMEKSGATQEDAEGLVGFVRSVSGVKIGAFLREKPEGTIKVSTRSNDDKYDCAEFCANFGGGGHLRAGGCNFADRDIKSALKTIKEAASGYISMRNSAS
jgi:phosphoesterase RecJ-like protein